MPEAEINETASEVIEDDARQENAETGLLTDKEYAELEMLVFAERNGEDVTFAAFHHLCPTGEEDAFDQDVCELYRSLAHKGMIEGAEAEAGFFFFNITERGRRIIPEPSLAARALSRTKGLAGSFDSLSEKFSVDMRTVAVSLGGAAVVGLITGIIGALIGNAVA